MPIDPEDSGIEQQQASNGGEQKGNREQECFWPTRICKTISNKFEAYREKKQSPEYRKERREIWNVRWLFLTVIFTFITAIIFYCQLREMKKVFEPVKDSAIAAKKAADAALTSQRPVLSLEMSLKKIKGIDDKSPVVIREGEIPKYVVLEIAFKNLNPMPAILRKIELKYAVLSSFTPEPVFTAADTYDIPPGTYLAGKEPPVKVQPDNFVIELSDEQREAIRLHKSDLVVYGRLYFDNFVDPVWPKN